MSWLVCIHVCVCFHHFWLTGSEALVCVPGEWDEYVGEVFVHLQTAGLKQALPVFNKSVL